MYYPGDHQYHGIAMTIERNFGFLLKDTASRYVARFEQRAERVGLTLAQCKILSCLVRQEGISQTQLAKLTALEPMAVVRLLDGMEADGLLERRLDKVDRRIKKLFLSARAGSVLEEIWKIAEATRSETFSGFSEEERIQFMQQLERLHINLLTVETRAPD